MRSVKLGVFMGWVLMFCLDVVCAGVWAAKTPPKSKDFQQAEKIRLKGQLVGQRLRMATLYGKACVAGHGRACWRGGALLAKSSSTALLFRKVATSAFAPKGKDPANPLLWFRRSCALGLGDGCFAWLEARKFGVDRRSRREKERLLKRACRLGSGAGCYQLSATQLKRLNQSKSGRHRRAKRRLERRYKKSLKMADVALARGCREQLERDCFLAGHLYFQGSFGRRDFEKAAQLLKRACVLHDAEGCDYLGLLLGGGMGLKQDLPHARKLHERACQLKSQDGCVHLAGLIFRGLGGGKDEVEARRLFRDACALNHPQGCLLLGEMMLRGEGGDRDLPAGLRMYRKACKVGQKVACRRVQAIEKLMKSKD